jgi:hypothetical protein
MLAEALCASKSPSTRPTIAPAPPAMLAPTASQLVGSGTQQNEAGPKSRRPKLSTANANTVRDHGDPAKGAHAAVLKLDRDDRERDG